MKKIVSLICLLSILLLSALPCHAEFNVTKMLESGLSLNDIADMIEADPSTAEVFSQIDANEIAVTQILLTRELQRRNINGRGVVVPIGTYIVGVDIPSGDYTVSYNGKAQSCVYVFPNIESVGGVSSSYYLLNPSLWETTSIGKLSLSDGQAIDIQYGPVVFAPYIGLGF